MHVPGCVSGRQAQQVTKCVSGDGQQCSLSLLAEMALNTDGRRSDAPTLRESVDLCSPGGAAAADELDAVAAARWAQRASCDSSSAGVTCP